MHHDVSLISTLAAGFALALALGFVASRLKVPPLVGYLLAGVAIGPATPGFVADVQMAGQLAEIGVMLLMFGVGLHFSVAELLAVRKVAVPGAIVQIAVAVALGFAATHAWGWSIGAGVVFGLCLSVASTVVLLKALETRGLDETVNGRIAVGWLIVEDLVMVLVLVLLPAFAPMLAASGEGASAEPPANLGSTIALTLAKVIGFIALMLVVGRRVFPRMLWWVARTGSRELFTLCVVASAVGVAYGAARLFDVSFALGAFFAGMMMRESAYSHRAADESLPLRDAFTALFFVSVGMLFDPAVLWTSPGKLALTVAIIVVGKTVAAVALVLLLRYPLSTALTVGTGLAQIGEFSFILAGLGMSLQLLPKEGQDLVLGAALLSIALNTALFAVLEPLRDWLGERSELARRLGARDDPLAELPTSVDAARLTGHVVLVDHGEVGQRVAALLHADQVPFVVADGNRAVVDQLRREGVAAVAGDPTDPAVLIQAHIARASVLLVTGDDTLRARRMVDIARQLNPAIQVLLHGASEDEAALLREATQGTVCVPSAALADGMAAQVLSWMRPAATRPHGATAGS
ncbi:cation:proton antiporter [uncultured Aquabacterium sp.]|jgi:CPA2 family monovalent cation:H+ antiporter-2|uniref:cation:proton antiporter n=1 Tax=uncultured Aquabacterium sp. TaxID=158753 RepID=UPI002618ED0A|nr:cation:proton antiporter [uncultured Aquabacterium sp.]